MSGQVPKTTFNLQEALRRIQEPDSESICPPDSSSDEDDLLFPERTKDAIDSDYLPPSESDDDYEPHLASVPGPSTAPLPTRRKAVRQSAPGQASPPPTALHTQSLAPQLSPGASPPPTALHTQSLAPQRRPAAPHPTTQQKRGRPSLGTSAPATKRGKSRLVSTESEEEEDRWHDKEEECIKPDPLRFKPARTPGPTCDTTIAWSPLSLFQLFFSATVVRKILDNTNANAAKRKNAGLKFKWEVLTMKDFYTFLAILIFTGLVTVPQMSDYWRKIWPYNFQFPSDSMTRDRFDSIMCSLHLSDPKEDEENDKKKEHC